MLIPNNSLPGSSSNYEKRGQTSAPPIMLHIHPQPIGGALVPSLPGLSQLIVPLC